MENTEVVKDYDTGVSLGHAFIIFVNAKYVTHALNEMNCEVLDGHPMRISPYQQDPSCHESGLRNVLVHNLPKDITDRLFYDTFHFGGSIILLCFRQRDENNVLTGSRFVRYADEEPAKRVIQMVNGCLIGWCKVHVQQWHRLASAHQQ